MQIKKALNIKPVCTQTCQALYSVQVNTSNFTKYAKH